MLMIRVTSCDERKNLQSRGSVPSGLTANLSHGVTSAPENKTISIENKQVLVQQL